MSGQKSELKASIGLLQGAALYVGAVLGSSILILPALTADMAGPAALVAWLGMTLLTLPMALSMGVLSARRPDAGGVSSFVREAFGEMAGAISGWFFFAALAIGRVLGTIAGAKYMAAAMGLGQSATLTVAAIALVTIWILQLLGRQIAGRVQVVLVGVTVAVLLLSIDAGAPQVRAAAFSPFMPQGWVSVGNVMATLFWGYLLPDRQTPAGSLLFLALAHIVIFTLFALGKVTIGTLIGLPNAGFIATYIVGSLAGVKLLKATGWPRWMAAQPSTRSWAGRGCMHWWLPASGIWPYSCGAVSTGRRALVRLTKAWAGEHSRSPNR